MAFTIVILALLVSLSISDGSRRDGEHRERDFPKMRQYGPTGEDAVGGFILYRLTDHGIQYLLMRHVEQDVWMLPKGTKEKYESIRQTALRETLEETGWLFKRDYRVELRFNVNFRYTSFFDNHIKDVHLWPARLMSVKTRPKLSEEHDRYLWLLYEDALHMIELPFKKVLLRAHRQISEAYKTA